MKKYESSIFIQALSILEKTGQSTMKNYLLQKRAFEKRIFEGQAYNQLVKDVAADVLGNISATVDVSEILGQIDELDKAIKKLGK